MGNQERPGILGHLPGRSEEKEAKGDGLYPEGGRAHKSVREAAGKSREPFDFWRISWIMLR